MTGRILLLGLLGVMGCDDYILPQREVETDRVDTILAQTGEVSAGSEAFGTHCEACHVRSGDADSAGPALAPLLPTHTDRSLVRVMLEGTGSMPAIDLTDKEAADLVAFLRDTFGGGDTDTASDTDTPSDTAADSDTDL